MNIKLQAIAFFLIFLGGLGGLYGLMVIISEKNLSILTKVLLHLLAAGFIAVSVYSFFSFMAAVSLLRV